MSFVAGMLVCLQMSGAPINQATDLRSLQTFHQDDRQEIELGAATVFPKLSSCLLISGPGQSGFFLHLWGKRDSWV